MNDNNVQNDDGQQDDTLNDSQQTSYNDSENTDTKYAKSLYEDSTDANDLNRDDLNPSSADLDAGVDDDAFQTFDSDDATLSSENDEDETETGMDEVDADNINPLQESMGDTVIDSDFSEEDFEE